ncbi:MAG: NUDIX hydrolase [Fervidobacterium sp.]
MLKLLGDYSYYAVCVPIVENNFLFEVRSSIVAQPLEVSFPGGKIEEGELPYEAASRELEEELNLKVNNKMYEIEPLVTPFNTVIFSYIVNVNKSDLKINTSEVLEVFEVPIEIFAKPIKRALVDVFLAIPDDFPYELIPNGRNYAWRKGKYELLFYKWEDKIIWGITAKIAQRAYDILRYNTE